MDHQDTIRAKSERFLVTLYMMADKETGKPVSSDRAFMTTAIHNDMHHSVLQRLAGELLVEWSDSSWISVTYKGQIEAERLMEDTYAEREQKVLRAIYEIGKRIPESMVTIDTLAKAVEMDSKELYPILTELEDRKGFIGSIDAVVWILPAGIEFLQQKRNTGPTGGNESGNNYTIVVHGNNSGAIGQGDGFTQTITQTNNAGFDEAIKAILEIVNSSHLSSEDKEEIVAEVVAINKLANKEQTTQIMEKAKLRLSMLDTLIKGADLGMKTVQYWPAIVAYFGS